MLIEVCFLNFIYKTGSFDASVSTVEFFFFFLVVIWQGANVKTRGVQPVAQEPQVDTTRYISQYNIRYTIRYIVINCDTIVTTIY